MTLDLCAKNYSKVISQIFFSAKFFSLNLLNYFLKIGIMFYKCTFSACWLYMRIQHDLKQHILSVSGFRCVSGYIQQGPETGVLQTGFLYFYTGCHSKQ